MALPFWLMAGAAAYYGAPLLKAGKNARAALQAAGIALAGYGVYSAARTAGKLTFKGFGKIADAFDLGESDQMQTPDVNEEVGGMLPPFSDGVEFGWKAGDVLAKIIDPAPGGTVTRSIFFGKSVNLTLEVSNNGDLHQVVTIDVHADLEMMMGPQQGPLTASTKFKVLGHSTRRITMELDTGNRWSPWPVVDLWAAWAAARVYVDGKLTHGTTFKIT